MKINKQRIGFCICLLVIVAFVTVFGYQLGAWIGFPKGVDAYARITRIVYILDYFPHIFWQYHWANGMPTFRSEAPLFYFLGAILAKVFSLGTENPLFVLGFASFVMVGFGVFGFVFTKTKSLTASLLSVFLALPSFSLWSWMVAGGIYPRIFGVGLSMIALWQVARFLEDVQKSEVFPRWKFILAVISLSATMTAHALMAFFVWIAVILLILTTVLPFKKRIKLSISLFGASFALAGFFFLPMLLSFGSGSATFIGVISEVIPAQLYFLVDITGVGPFILPLLALTLIAALMMARSVQSEVKLLRLIFAPLCMFFLFSVYALIGYTGLPGRYYYINGFIPLSATLFMGIYGSILIGLLTSRLEKAFPRFLPFLVLGVTVIIGLFSTFLAPNMIKNDNRFKNIYDSGAVSNMNEIYALQHILKFPPEQDFNHRFAPFDAFEAVWFNAWYKIPQVRDYYGQGILYPDWRYWFEQAVWNQKKFSVEEAHAALDWFAVRWFSYMESDACLVDYGHLAVTPVKPCTIEEFMASSPNRYLHQPDIKLPVFGRYRDGGLWEQFEVDKPSPILSAVNTPSTLFIGDPVKYYILFSNLTFDNYSSGKVIPIRGKVYLDDYSTEELQSYQSLILYSYKYHNSQSAAKILTDYLNQGGNVFWETWDSPEAAAKLEKPDLLKLLSSSGLEQTSIDDGNWNLQIKDDPLTQGIKADSFSPPLYEGSPWKITTLNKTSLPSGAQVLLSSGEKPLLAVYTIGKGKVFWSGFNFLYHINDYKNLEETKIFYNILDQMGKPAEATQPSFSAEFINPEKRIVNLTNPARGVLFKESFYPNWSASVIDNKGKQQDLKINLAGPGMMYASLNGLQNYPATVVFQYHFSLIEKLGFASSALALIVLVIYGFIPTILERFLTRVQKSNPVLKKTSTFWEDEED